MVDNAELMKSIVPFLSAAEIAPPRFNQKFHKKTIGPGGRPFYGKRRKPRIGKTRALLEEDRSCNKAVTLVDSVSRVAVMRKKTNIY
ncbi:hypothetical protein CEXT_559921 [Caerostris extrusa]|uniref:Uncharacterized protein n=1 Tax=Caerostris extrusa TaxID=172846 RepID=A0AAV4PEF5_CAEEX|nr:hypothetical protein CEXT_559921 [Caerostris extrusa]